LNGIGTPAIAASASLAPPREPHAANNNIPTAETN